jgi:hypothetical protein
MFGFLLGRANDPKDEAAVRRVVARKNALLLVLTIGGGTSGVLNCLVWAVKSSASAREIAFLGLIAAVYAFGIWAGIECQLHSARSQKCARAFLLAQVPVLQSPLVSFKCTALYSYTVIFYWKASILEANGYLGDDWGISLFHATPDMATGVNLLPLGMMSLIWGPSMMWRAARRSS